jgi:hypothetical protein
VANQIRVQAGLQVGSFYVSQPQAVVATQQGSAGPTPGDLLVTPAGIDVSLAELSVPGGMCRMYNKDLVAWVEWGVFDYTSNKFYPVGKLIPGGIAVLQLSPNLGVQVGTGSGSVPTESSETLRFRSHGGNARVVVDCFDA